MSSHARIKVALAGGAVMVALAAGAGGGAGLSNATATPAPAAPAAPTKEPPASSGVPAPSTTNNGSSGRTYYLVPSRDTRLMV